MKTQYPLVPDWKGQRHRMACLCSVPCTFRFLFLRFPTQKASWQLLRMSMAFTRYTNCSRVFFSRGTWFVSPVSWRIWNQPHKALQTHKAGPLLFSERQTNWTSKYLTSPPVTYLGVAAHVMKLSGALLKSLEQALNIFLQETNKWKPAN